MRPLPEASPCQTRMEVEFARARVTLNACGGLFLPDLRVLVVSDLHLEKGSFFASRGNLMPCHDTRDTLTRLAETIRIYAPRTVICLGDSFHDRLSGARMRLPDAALLRQLIGGMDEWVWLTGNHDPEIPDGVPGSVAPCLRLGALTLCHRPEDGTRPLIAGHYHPKHTLRLAGRHVAARCFVLGDGLLLMPAFGAYAGGLRTADAAIAGLFDPAPSSYVLIYRDKLWAIGHN